MEDLVSVDELAARSTGQADESTARRRYGSCRICAAPLHRTFADLGVSPLANSFLSPERAERMEPFYPLHALVCEVCHLVQLAEFETPQQIFGDYLYFSSFSTSWLRSAESYAAQMTPRFGLGQDSLVVEVASNDGYLLQYFASAGIPVLGVEPAANIARFAREKGIKTEVAFFGGETGRRLHEVGLAPDLIVANNVLAHVPDLHDFVEGFRILLSPHGVATFEFPHLAKLVHHNQFDTIYHEHFSYLSFAVVEALLAQHGMVVFDVEELPTHGGSLRVYVQHAANPTHAMERSVLVLRQLECGAGLARMETYDAFAGKVVETKCALLEFLVGARRNGKSVVAYGAPAKGNTLLNYCGVGPELIGFTVDRSPHKQGMLLPGVRIPIRSPDAIEQARPDYVLLLPWNLRNEIADQLSSVRAWGGRLVVPIPTVEVF